MIVWDNGKTTIKKWKVKLLKIFWKILEDQNVNQLLQDILLKSHKIWVQTITQAMIISDKTLMKVKIKTENLIIWV